MFEIISRIFGCLTSPVIWIIIVLGYGIFTKIEKRRKRALWIAFFLVLFFTNPFICNEVWVLWETPPVPLASLGKFDAAIILNGGLTNSERSPHDRVYTGKNADRELQPLQLYKLGIIQNIIISGGPDINAKDYIPESAGVKKILVDACVPENAIIIEDKSANTHENAVNCKKVLADHPDFKKILLVTSAFHMRRALSCFKKEHVDVVPFGTDFFSHDRSFDLDDVIVPSETSLENWQLLLHEVFGYMMYKIVGYC